MWTVEPEQIWRRPRVPGISGFMRLKNEAEFLDRAIASHITGLDELIIVHNDCSDQTPEIALRWARRAPDKIKVFEYEPKVVPIGTPEALTIDPRSPRCIANYYNFALALTSRAIAVKVDGDHLAVAPRFQAICEKVRRRLRPKMRYPIYGLNITDADGAIVIYNYYHFAPGFVGDRRQKKGPPPFTSGDHCFYYVDETCWHTVDPVEGYEVLSHEGRPRSPDAPFTYCFFHLKGLKRDRGTGNWGVGAARNDGHLRDTWVDNVLAPDLSQLSSIGAMRRHNPVYFRGADFERELREALPQYRVRAAREVGLPSLGLREKLAHLWYRASYP